MGGSSSKQKKDSASAPNDSNKSAGAANSTSGPTRLKTTLQAQGIRITCTSCLTAGCLPENPVQGWMFLHAVPCGHRYCEPCIAKRCFLGLQDRSLVPAHCCGMEFPTEYIKKALGVANFSTYSRYLTERRWQSTTLRSDSAYAATVKTLGGMQCPRCGIGVTRISGCSTIHCLCGGSFPYTGRVG